MRFNPVLIAVALLAATPAFPCSVAGPGPTPLELVGQAELIVHVRAVSVERAGKPEPGYAVVYQVAFDVIRVLKGTHAEKVLRVNGRQTDRDDFNDHPVPYTVVRPEGRRGSCFAQGYRIGAEYLLLLRRDEDNRWSPYWSALQPTNEQVVGAADAWIEWVAKQIR